MLLGVLGPTVHIITSSWSAGCRFPPSIDLWFTTSLDRINTIPTDLWRRLDYGPLADAPASTASCTDDDDCVACVTLVWINTAATSAVDPIYVDIAGAYFRDEIHLSIVLYFCNPSVTHCGRSASTRAQITWYAFNGRFSRIRSIILTYLASTFVLTMIFAAYHSRVS